MSFAKKLLLLDIKVVFIIFVIVINNATRDIFVYIFVGVTSWPQISRSGVAALMSVTTLFTFLSKGCE